MTGDGGNLGLVSIAGERATVSMAASRVELPEEGESFARVFGLATIEGEKTTESAQSEARRVAEELVGITMIQPILSQLRATNQAAEPFAPGLFEKRFAPLLDAEIATRITRASSFPLVDRLEQDLLRSMGGERGLREGESS